MPIDCGIFVGISGGANRLRDMAKDIAKTTGNHLHVVVATHEHWDHLIGFHYAKETFGSNKMMIDEVWLAWTEDLERDQLARDLHQQYEAAAMALTTATMRLEKLDDPSVEPIRDVLAYHRDFEGALGVTTNELMDKVHKEIIGHPAHYCNSDNPPITLPGVPGLRFYILGPPRDESLLRILEEERAFYSEPLTLDEAAAFYYAVLTAFGEVPEADQRAIYDHMNQRSRPFSEPLGMTNDEAQAYKVNDEFFFRARALACP